VKILGKVENLVFRILRSFSTGDENRFDVHDERGKCTIKCTIKCTVTACTVPLSVLLLLVMYQ
jgi:hypothetical protein